MTDEVTVGNEQAPVEDQVSHDTQNSSSDSKVNPGAIRKSTTQGILNALSTASGHDFNSVEDAISYIAKTQSRKTSGGNEQPVAQPQESNTQFESQDTDLQEQFMKLRRDLESKERALAQKELDSQIISVMGDKFDPDLMDYALQKVKNNLKVNRDGSYAIVNQKGQERYGIDGNPLSINSLVDEIAQGNPKLLKQNHVSGGSGLRPGQGKFAGAPNEDIPDYSRDPAAFDAWAKNMGLGRGAGLKGVTVTASDSSNSRKVL